MGHIPNLLADVVELAGAENRDLAARWLVESRQSAQQSSFSGAVIAKNGVEFAAGKFRSHASQRRKPAKLLDQVRDCDDGGGSGFSQWLEPAMEMRRRPPGLKPDG